MAIEPTNLARSHRFRHAGAVFPLLFGCMVYPLCGLRPSIKRFANFLGLLTLESFSSR